MHCGWGWARPRATLPGARILDRGAVRCAIVTLTLDGRDATTLRDQLRARRINTSVSARKDGVIDMDAKGVSAALRVSPHYYNTEAEIDTLVAALAELTR
jgi:selenocysteine lyase/cysteine desulfurase